jgi:hypothetical protein
MDDSNNNITANNNTPTGEIPPLPSLPPPPAVDPTPIDLSGIEGLGLCDVSTRPEVIRHARAFHAIINPMMEKMSESKVVPKKTRYDMILNSLYLHRSGHSLHYWHKAYAVIIAGEDTNSKILVSRPTSHIGVMDVPLEDEKRIAYLEMLFTELLLAYGSNHTKGRTLYGRICACFANVSQHVCKIFSDTCPNCVMEQQRLCPLAGLQPIVTEGFGTCGQVDLIDFQSKPDHGFHFLMNYINHGIKSHFCHPIQHKRASCVAFALFQIFTEIGPPMIL